MARTLSRALETVRKTEKMKLHDENILRHVHHGMDDLCVAGSERGTEKSVLIMVGNYNWFPRPCRIG